MQHMAYGVLIQVSPLLLATQQGHLKVVKILLGHPRIDVTLTNEVGYNALAEAIVKGYRQVVKIVKNNRHHQCIHNIQ